MVDVVPAYEATKTALGYNIAMGHSLALNIETYIAGVDEAGRGPLAGPVFAAAVVLGAKQDTQDIDDSKKLSPSRREELSQLIKKESLCWNIASATVEEIDKLNILQASLLAMKRAVEGLSQPIDKVLVDGIHLPELVCNAEAVVGGDGKFASIAAASILAKVARDRKMRELDLEYPDYGFAKHKGYPTAVHINALREHGISPAHRRTFNPIKSMLGGA